MSEEIPVKGKKEPKQMSPSLGCLVVGVVVFVFFGLMAGSIVLFEVPYRLLVGWLHFLTNNLTAVEINWEMAACGLAALALATFGFHRGMIWIRNDKPWKWTWTLSLTALMLSLFAASVAMTGIIHQMAWMTREPLIQSSHRSIITQNVVSAKQIFLLMIEYDDDFGGYPASLQDLASEGYISAETMQQLMFQPGGRRAPEPWICLGDRVSITDENVEGDSNAMPVMISPQAYDGKWIVLNLDGSVQIFRFQQLKEKYPALVKKLPNMFPKE